MDEAKLVKMRDFLDTKVRARGLSKLDMYIWANGYFTDLEIGCETIACALGHATVLFPDEIYLVKERSRFIIKHRRFKSVHGYVAAEHLFDLSFTAVDYIFAPWHYPVDQPISVDHVIQHINDVLEGRRD